MMGKELTHIVLAKFKEEVSEEKIEECIKYFANYCHRVPSVKAVKWGKEMGITNLNQGFTHVFELTFERAEGVIEYIIHPNHIDLEFFLLPNVENMIIVDFEHTKVQS